jgi:arylsulfatase A-like enzyme
VRFGTKLAPVPWEYASRRPVCAPVREPTTLSTLSRAAGAPRKLIWVSGVASRAPDSGDTVTEPAFKAEVFNAAGRQAGPRCTATALALDPKPRATADPRMTARMESIDPPENRRVDRRTFLKTGLVAGGALAGAGLGIRALADTDGTSRRGSAAPAGAAPPRSARSAPKHPNILVIVVDQLRFPQWFSAGALGMGLPPNMADLRRTGVSFARHYTASNDCSPSRSALLTGLYTHQTGCMITGGSTLDPGFPTWGTMLRDHGYRTRWLGKWHLTHRDNHWSAPAGEAALERYGFAGGVYPSPDGGPGQGWHKDPHIAADFADWFANEGGSEPWCTTVSFVNPHDIAWWYRWSDRVPAEAAARPTVRGLPPNFETPQLLTDRHKPRLQHSLQQTAAASFGEVPFEGQEAELLWLSFLDLYAKLQRRVDRHIGEVLHALHSKPKVAANTVIVFTSDHGEYGSSHGLRGKGAGAYEEAIRVPLIVRDPRPHRRLTSAPNVLRTQLTSSVDVAPLLLTIATGSSAWRGEHHYAHLAGRLDLASILADPNAPGRPYVLHATDEVVTEFAVEPYAADAPLHVVAMRTPQAKYATYSHWASEGITPVSEGEEDELYDYSTQTGRLELHNSAGESALEEGLREQLQQALHHELREPLTGPIGEAHGRGFADYFSTARRAADGAAARRKRREERSVGPIEETPVEAAGGDQATARPSRRRRHL